MRHLAIAVLLLLVSVAGCSRADAPAAVPRLKLGDAAFYPTIEAYTRAPITSTNRVEVLLTTRSRAC